MNQSLRCLSPLALLFLVVSAGAQIPLRGFQDGQYDRGGYRIDSLVTIGEGKNMVLLPGTVIRFGTYGSIRVRGELTAKGTVDNPVLFTSYRDRPGGEPAPFDWVGITVDSGGTVDLSHVRIAYSTVGLTLVDTTVPSTIDQVVFSDNGTADVSLEGKELLVSAGERWSLNPPSPVLADTGKAPSDTMRTVSPAIASPAWKRPVRWTCAGIGAASLVTALVARIVYHSRLDRYNDATDTGTADELQREGERAAAIWNVALPVGLCSAAGFGVTFFF